MGALAATIIVCTLLLYIIIGIVASRRVKSPEDYFIAGSKLSLIPLLGTYIATYFSGVSMLGLPGSIYTLGISTLWLPIYWALGTIILIFVALRFRKVSMITPADFFRVRYGSKLLEFLVAMTSFIALIFGLIVQFKTMGIAWSLALGRPYSEGVIITAITILIILVAGGLVSVAWSDVLKAVIFITAIFVGGIWTMVKYGGIGTIINNASKVSPSLASPVGHYTGVGLFFLAFIWIFGVATHPQYLQRVSAGKDLRTVLYQYLISWPILALIYLFLAVMALQARVLMPTLPGGLGRDYVLPLYFKNYTNVALYGIFLAGLIAAALSTTDSVIQLAASLFTVNGVKLLKPDIPPKTMLSIGRVVSFVLTVLIAYLAIKPLPVILYLAGYAWGLLAVGYFAPTVFGLYWRRANTQGALASVIGGWIIFIIAQTMAKAGMWPYKEVSPVAVGVLVALILFPVVSLLTPPSPKERVEPFFK